MQLSRRFSLTRGQTSLLGLMMLRGPQTTHELLARSERMAQYGSVDDLVSDLDLLIGRRPPLVQLVERGPGQREDRYAHLLSGPVEAATRTSSSAPFQTASPDLAARVAALEDEVSALRRMVEKLAGND